MDGVVGSIDWLLNICDLAECQGQFPEQLVLDHIFTRHTLVLCVGVGASCKVVAQHFVAPGATGLGHRQDAVGPVCALGVKVARNVIPGYHDGAVASVDQIWTGFCTEDEAEQQDLIVLVEAEAFLAVVVVRHFFFFFFRCFVGIA